jgi:hypothetical protein
LARVVRSDGAGSATSGRWPSSSARSSSERERSQSTRLAGGDGLISAVHRQVRPFGSGGVVVAELLYG